MTTRWMSSRHRRKLSLTCTGGYRPCAVFPSKARNRRWKWPSRSPFRRLWFRQHLWLKSHRPPGLERDLGSAPSKDAGSRGNIGCPRIGQLGPAIQPTYGFCLANYWAFVFSLRVNLVSNLSVCGGSVRSDKLPKWRYYPSYSCIAAGSDIFDETKSTHCNSAILPQLEHSST